MLFHSFGRLTRELLLQRDAAPGIVRNQPQGRQRRVHSRTRLYLHRSKLQLLEQQRLPAPRVLQPRVPQLRVLELGRLGLERDLGQLDRGEERLAAEGDDDVANVHGDAVDDLVDEPVRPAGAVRRDVGLGERAEVLRRFYHQFQVIQMLGNKTKK